MSEPVARFTVSIPPDLLEGFDNVCAKKGYSSRSEAIRDAIRDYLVSHAWDEAETQSDAELVGSIVLLYDHEIRKLSEELLEHQHHHHSHVLSSLHVHLDARNCLEVIVVRGNRAEVTQLADSLIALKGVKFGRLVVTAPDA